MQGVQISHIFGERNRAANFLARVAREATLHRGGVIFLKESSARMHSILIDDILSRSSIRNVNINTNAVEKAPNDTDQMTLIFVSPIFDIFAY